MAAIVALSREARRRSRLDAFPRGSQRAIVDTPLTKINRRPGIHATIKARFPRESILSNVDPSLERLERMLRVVRGSSLRMLVVLFTALIISIGDPVMAQTLPQANTFSQDELDQLLAPIALHPDDLLTQILAASTYPLEVVEAARFVHQNPNLRDGALDDAVSQRNWDPSVQSLTAFPTVLAMMSDRLEWTERVGDAFLADQQRVMDTRMPLSSSIGPSSPVLRSSPLNPKRSTTTGFDSAVTLRYLVRRGASENHLNVSAALGSMLAGPGT